MRKYHLDGALMLRPGGTRHAATALALLIVGVGMLGLLLLLKQGPSYQADIRRSTHGIPHIRARDWAGLGYGYGYVYAEDNACLLAERLLTVRGERSRYFGPGGGNFASDVYHRAVLDELGLEQLIAAQPRRVRALVQGVAAGFARALRDPEAQVASICRGEEWLQAPSERDLFRHLWALTLMLGSEPYAGAIARARPPQSGDIKERANERPRQRKPGSNGYALGAEVSANGRGLLLANPHLAWQGVQRFYPVHLTIPGALDVMGASLQGVPAVLIGFNRELAWTATVSTARRATLYQLQLVPGDPTAYRYHGEVRRMRAEHLRIQVLDPRSGILRSRAHTVYFSHYGPVLETDGPLAWTAQNAFAIRDANLANTRFLNQFLRLGRARDMGGFVESLRDEQGIPWSNTLAVDAAGNALYADVGVIPNTPDDLLRNCQTALGRALAPRGLLLLDGSRARCEWREDLDARQAGIMPAAKLPLLQRRDYLVNANDSPWLSNPKAPLVGYPKVLGDVNTPRSLRTRLALDQIRARLEGRDGLPGNRFRRQDLAEILFGNRDLGGELLLDDLLSVCGRRPATEIEAACSALAGWDRHNNLASRGAHVFKEVIQALGPLGPMWRVPFDPELPLDTPRGLALERAQVRAAAAAALTTAARRLARAGVAPNAALGEVQFHEAGGVRIPIHGGSDSTGAFNVIESALSAEGYSPIVWGSSFILVVGFDDEGPRAEMGLSYSLASDPASPYVNDLSRLYANKQLVPVPFREAEIRAQSLQPRKRLRE
jgi:acyl-homoserine-lactone acylase